MKYLSIRRGVLRLATRGLTLALLAGLLPAGCEDRRERERQEEDRRGKVNIDVETPRGGYKVDIDYPKGRDRDAKDKKADRQDKREIEIEKD